mmetsp:Transcript_48013/g.70157  ORF Transcript_48013/g.70157 Transcript_48013/m.70157 type:complete len:136 (+) Transcript_48013:292-699(+)
MDSHSYKQAVKLPAAIKISSKEVKNMHQRKTSPVSKLACLSDSFVISRSMKGTNLCRACKSHIDEGSLKFGVMFTLGEQGQNIRMCWYHLDAGCIRPPSCIKSPSQVCGSEDLKGPDQTRLNAWIGHAVSATGDA